MSGNDRKDIKPGLKVDIVLKQDQRTGRLTRGVVKDVLTKSPSHPYGIKVRLETVESAWLVIAGVAPGLLFYR